MKYTPLVVYPFFDLCCSKINLEINGFFEFFREINDPNLTDILMISGYLSHEYIVKIDELKKIMQPKFIIAIGNCTSNLEIFKSDLTISPHVIIKGCPPNLEDIKDGYLKILKMMK